MEERFRDFKLEQEPKLEISERGPDKALRDRSILLSRAPHLDDDPEGKEMEPLRFADFRVRVSKWSRVKRKVKTRLRLVFKRMELKSMAETRVATQVTPRKEVHGFWPGSQFWSSEGFGFGREALKFRSCRVSLEDEEEEEEEDVETETALGEK